MARLRGCRCYLGGSMDRVVDGGVGYRSEIKSKLQSLGIKFFDPTDKCIKGLMPECEARKLIAAAKMVEDYDTIAHIIKPIRCVDLRAVDRSDFMIVYLDGQGFGTIEELVLGNRQKKPIIIINKGGKQKAPNWLFAMLPHEYIFGCIDDAVAYIKEIDNSNNNLNRWVFFED